AGNGTAILLTDSNTALPSAVPDFAGVTNGAVGDENEFAVGLDRFIALNPSGAGGPVTVDLDASQNLYGVASDTPGDYLPGSMSIDQLFEVEDKIQHEVDVASLGFVTIVAANIYVTQDSFLAPHTAAASVQRGINAAGAHSNTVHVNAGSYAGALTISKDLDVVGYGAPTIT